MATRDSITRRPPVIHLPHRPTDEALLSLDPLHGEPIAYWIGFYARLELSNPYQRGTHDHRHFARGMIAAKMERESEEAYWDLDRIIEEGQP
jgi:hypothetical protein